MIVSVSNSIGNKTSIISFLLSNLFHKFFGNYSRIIYSIRVPSVVFTYIYDKKLLQPSYEKFLRYCLKIDQENEDEYCTALQSNKINKTCEINHPNEKCCVKSCVTDIYHHLKVSFNVYTPIYIIGSILNRRIMYK